MSISYRSYEMLRQRYTDLERQHQSLLKTVADAAAFQPMPPVHIDCPPAIYADAQRYRWLRDNSATYTSPKVPIQLIVQEGAEAHRTHGAIGYRKGLDVAIDAAMSSASTPLGQCVRPGHPAECQADPKVGCVGWSAAPAGEARTIGDGRRPLSDFHIKPTACKFAAGGASCAFACGDPVCGMKGGNISKAGE